MNQKNRSYLKFFILLGIVLLLMVGSFVFCRGQSRGIIVSADDVLTTLDDAGFKVVYVEPDTLHDYCPWSSEIDARLFEFSFRGTQYSACVRIFDDWDYAKELSKWWNKTNRRMDYNFSFATFHGPIVIDFLPIDRYPKNIPEAIVKIYLNITLMFSEFS